MERRKFPRYPLRLRVYFPEHDIWGVTRNISVDGCFVRVRKDISEGFMADLLIEIPLVGVLMMKGYVHHCGVHGEGLGMQFVQVRFAEEQTGYYSLYTDFVHLLSELKNIHKKYLELIKQGSLRPYNFPKEARKKPIS